MTAEQFKAWFCNQYDDRQEAPTQEQWTSIKASVRDIDVGVVEGPGGDNALPFFQAQQLKSKMLLKVVS